MPAFFFFLTHLSHPPPNPLTPDSPQPLARVIPEKNHLLLFLTLGFLPLASREVSPAQDHCSLKPSPNHPDPPPRLLGSFPTFPYAKSFDSILAPRFCLQVPLVQSTPNEGFARLPQTPPGSSTPSLTWRRVAMLTVLRPLAEAEFRDKERAPPGGRTGRGRRVARPSRVVTKDFLITIVNMPLSAFK